MCSGFNPFTGVGAPIAANYWGQINNAKSQGVGTDSNTYGTAGPNGIFNNLPLDSGAPEVVWATNSVGASKTSGVIAAVAATPGGVGYVSPSNTLGANTQEAYVENYAGNYEQATATTVAASFAGTSTSSATPPGYPSETKTTPYLYFPFPTASAGDALVGYSYGYFYTCYPKRLSDQVAGFEDLFAYAEKEPATDAVVASFWNLNSLDTGEQKALKTALGLIQKAPVTKAKDYYSPVNGAELKYTCTDN
jgi:ABC-type phosphate transport system substrate-binding protein